MVIDLAFMFALVPTMSTSITGQGSSASQHLRTTKKVLQDVILNAGYVWNDEMRHTTG